MSNIPPLYPDTERQASDRLTAFLVAAKLDGGPIEEQVLNMGSPADWAHSAKLYLSCMLTGTQGGTLGGTVEVSAAAIGVVLGYLEDLEIGAGIVPAPGGSI